VNFAESAIRGYNPDSPAPNMEVVMAKKAKKAKAKKAKKKRAKK
jgi:hypothetical protein